MQDYAKQPAVVIVGAGFGGHHGGAAAGRSNIQILLIDRTNHHVFQPLLYQTATAALAPSDIASPVRGILRRQLEYHCPHGRGHRRRPVRRVVHGQGHGEFDSTT